MKHLLIVIILIMAGSILAQELSDYQTRLSRLDQAVVFFEARAEEDGDSWLRQEQAAQAYLERARLTGNYDDFSQAEAYLDRAFALTPEGAGPWLSSAQFNYTMHRFDLSQEHLDRAMQRLLISDQLGAAMQGLAGDLAFQRGDYQEALENFQEALELDESNSNLFRMAHYHWKTGDFSQAEDYINQAETEAGGTDARLSAFLHLHRGLLDLDRGRYTEALEHYRAADLSFSGWWLVQEHIAEIYVLQGELVQARAIYEDVIDTTGNPEFMDALAELAAQEGQSDEAERWRQQAQEGYEAQIRAFPEASYGHALGHYLDNAQGERAVSLARANYDLRPNAESALWLAQSYLLIEQFEEAEGLIVRALESPWRNADLYATAAEIFEARGLNDQAELARQQALEINPDSISPSD